MAPKTPSKTTQVTEVKLPEWVDKASQANYAEAEKLGQQPYNPFPGKTVADLGSATQQGIGLIQGNAGKAQSGFNSAAGIFDKLAGSADALKPTTIGADQVKADAVRAGLLKDADLSAYMNPYTQSVIDTSLADMDRGRQKALMDVSSNAVSNNAFGGSRQGILEGVTNAESALKQGQLSSQLRADAYDKAVGMATGDIDRTLATDTNNANRNLAAATTNAGNNLSAANANANNILNTFTAKAGAQNTAAQGLMSAAEGGQTAAMKDFAALLQAGGIQQGQSQKEIDAAIEKWDGKRNYDIDNLNLKLSALGMSPYGKTETATKTGTAGNSGTDIGQMGMGIFSLLLGLSEDDTKTDKEKVGKVPGTDLDLWAYRYKKDPKTYPKVVGVMASDVEKKMPEAVHKVDGKRTINYGLIGQKMGAA